MKAVECPKSSIHLATTLSKWPVLIQPRASQILSKPTEYYDKSTSRIHQPRRHHSWSCICLSSLTTTSTHLTNITSRCGHSAIDDPDGTRIYDEALYQIEKDLPELKDDISIMRLGPIDQELNALLSQARVACQLSTREGFEVKVSEA